MWFCSIVEAEGGSRSEGQGARELGIGRELLIETCIWSYLNAHTNTETETEHAVVENSEYIYHSP